MGQCGPSKFKEGRAESKAGQQQPPPRSSDKRHAEQPANASPSPMHISTDVAPPSAASQTDAPPAPPAAAATKTLPPQPSAQEHSAPAPALLAPHVGQPPRGGSGGGACVAALAQELPTRTIEGNISLIQGTIPTAEGNRSSSSPLGPSPPSSSPPGSAAMFHFTPGAQKPPARDPKEDITIVLPKRKEPTKFKEPPKLSAITPGRSLTASVLGRGVTPNVKDVFHIGKKLGSGQYGTAYLCTEKASGERFACKTIPRNSLISEEDVEDVRTEVFIMYRLAGQPNVVRIKGTYEDRYYVHIVMELCSGGELFDKINERMAHSNVPYSEKDASMLAKSIIRAVDACHASGVIHRDLKPENFLFTTKGDDAVLKVTDFGMAAIFKPGSLFDRACGSAMYMAPEVIRLWKRRHGHPKVGYGPEVDIFGAGVILFILLCGEHPFPPPPHDRSDSGYMRAILKGKPNFSGPEWVTISRPAQDLIRAMVDPDPKQRPTAHDLLGHPWIVNAPDEPLDISTVKRFKTFIDLVMLKKLKRVAMRAMAEKMDEEELERFKELIVQKDTKNEEIMTVEDLRMGLAFVGAREAGTEVQNVINEMGIDVKSTFEYPRFLDATIQLSKITKQENLFKGLSLYDEDLSGYITEDELRRACKEFRVDNQSMQELMQEVNRDDDGRIDYNEFVAMMRKESGGVGRKGVETAENISLRDLQDAAEGAVA